MELNNALIAKAKQAKTPEELLCLAKENGEEITLESAKAYFELLHSQTGEIADEELDNVSGGGCYKGDRLVVSAMHYCDEWRCRDDGSQCDVYGVHWSAAIPAGLPRFATPATTAHMKRVYGFATVP